MCVSVHKLAINKPRMEYHTEQGNGRMVSKSLFSRTNESF